MFFPSSLSCLPWLLRVKSQISIVSGSLNTCSHVHGHTPATANLPSMTVPPSTLSPTLCQEPDQLVVQERDPEYLKRWKGNRKRSNNCQILKSLLGWLAVCMSAFSGFPHLVAIKCFYNVLIIIYIYIYIYIYIKSLTDTPSAQSGRFKSARC